MVLEERRKLLIECLNDPDDKVSSAAASALEKLEALSGLTQIFEGLKSSSRDHRVRAIFAIDPLD